MADRHVLQLNYLHVLTVVKAGGEVLMWSGPALNQAQANWLFQEHPNAAVLVEAHDYALRTRPTQLHELQRPTIEPVK